MTHIDTILLGIVQGLTEFLPVSSSGHLVLFEYLLELKEPELLLDTSLHLGTLLAVCLFFRNDLTRMIQDTWSVIARKPGASFIDTRHASLTLMVVIGSIPTALMGVFFKDWVEGLFASVTFAGIMLFLTGAIVGLTRFIPRSYGTHEQVTWLMALAVGTAQGFAIMPGISRSGATIVCALFLGLKRDMAGRFSFLLSIPAIVGAVALQLEAQAFDRIGIIPLLAGFAASALVGLLALKILMGMVRKGHLYYFAPYCWLVGLLIILFAGR